MFWNKNKSWPWWDQEAARPPPHRGSLAQGVRRRSRLQHRAPPPEGWTWQCCSPGLPRVPPDMAQPSSRGSGSSRPASPGLPPPWCQRWTPDPSQLRLLENGNKPKWWADPFQQQELRPEKWWLLGYGGWERGMVTSATTISNSWYSEQEARLSKNY